jgi:DNA-binding protein H-NS
MAVSGEVRIIKFPKTKVAGGLMLPKKSSLGSLSNQALCKLRDEIDKVLNSRAESLQSEIDQLIGPTSFANIEHRRDPRKGRRKVAPKYRGPHGEMWSGGGLKPRWLTIAISEGKQLEDFLIPLDARPGPRKKVRPKLVSSTPSGKEKIAVQIARSHFRAAP